MSHQHMGKGGASDRQGRDLLRFMYQTSAKGGGKSYQEWVAQWKNCMDRSKSVDANFYEGYLFDPFRKLFQVSMGCFI